MFECDQWSMSYSVCEFGMPDDLRDGHVPHCFSEGLSSGIAAALSLLHLFLSWSPSCHTGENSTLSLPSLLVT